jgi:hypothetical protein
MSQTNGPGGICSLGSSGTGGALGKVERTFNFLPRDNFFSIKGHIKECSVGCPLKGMWLHLGSNNAIKKKKRG